MSEYDLHSTFADLMTGNFTQNEVEHLTDFADYFFEKVERGIEISLPDDLILDTLALFDGEPS